MLLSVKDESTTAAMLTQLKGQGAHGLTPPHNRTQAQYPAHALQPSMSGKSTDALQSLRQAEKLLRQLGHDRICLPASSPKPQHMQELWVLQG